MLLGRVTVRVERTWEAVPRNVKAITSPGMARPNADRLEILRQGVPEQQGEWKAITGSVSDDTMEVFQFLELVLYVAAAEPPSWFLEDRLIQLFIEDRRKRREE